MGDHQLLQGNVLALSDIDPELKEYLEKTPLPAGGFANGPLDVARGQSMNFERQQYETTPLLGITEFTINIPMRDGYKSEIRVFNPSTLPPSGRPLVVLIHGGGFMVGSNIQLVAYARTLSAVYSVTTVCLSYRLAPEFPFPTAPNDTWDSIKWLAANASTIGANPAQGFVLGGVSAGGNLTTVTAQRAVKEKLSPPLTGIWVCIPATTVTPEGLPEKYRADWVSRYQNAEAPIMSTKDIEVLRGIYNPDLLSEDFSPFVHTELASSIPPAYIQVEGLDPLRDDGLIYERYLREHGVKTLLDIYPGVPHCHFMYLPWLKASKRFKLDTVAGFAWLLNKVMDKKRLADNAGALELELPMDFE